jgi:hypothetical protein
MAAMALTAVSQYMIIRDIKKKNIATEPTKLGLVGNWVLFVAKDSGSSPE